MSENLLKKQLELVRFEKVIEYINVSLHGQKHLNPQELAIINNKLAGHKDDADSWRQEETVIQLKSGVTRSISIISNPFFVCRDILSNAFLVASNESLEKAALYLYIQLVLHHFFQDANRRTAAAATYWLLLHNQIDVNAQDLLLQDLGDLHNVVEIKKLDDIIRSTIEKSKN